MSAGQVWELLLENVDGEPEHRVTLLTLEVPAPKDRFYAKREALARCLVLDSSAEDTWASGDVGDWELADFHTSGICKRIG